MSEYLNDVQRSQLRQRLIQQRQELRELQSQRQEAARPIELDQTLQGRLSRMDAMQGQAMAKAALERAQAQAHQIAIALTRIDDEEFGLCEECGEPIAFARLCLDPCHCLCIGCAELRERS